METVSSVRLTYLLSHLLDSYRMYMLIYEYGDHGCSHYKDHPNMNMTQHIITQHIIHHGHYLRHVT